MSALTLLAINPVSAQEKINDNLPLIVTNPTLQYEVGTFTKNAKWQSLSYNINGCEIKHTKVKIVKKSVEHFDSMNPFNSLRVIGQPYALFPNGKFKEGKVITWYKAEKPSIDIDQFWETKQFKD